MALKSKALAGMALWGAFFILSTLAFSGEGGPTGGGGGGGGNISGTITTGNTGNPAAYTTQGTTVGPVINEIHALSGTLAAAIAACPGGNAACTVIADPGMTYNIPAPLAIGSATKPVTLIIDNAILNCTDTTGGRDCVDVYDKGKIIGLGAGSGSVNTGGIITNSASSNITSLVANGNTTNQAGLDIENVFIEPNRSSTISKAPLYLSSVDGFAYISNLTLSGPPNSTPGVLIDDGASPGDFFNAIYFNNLNAACSGATGTKLVSIVHNGGTSGSNVTFSGGSMVDCGYTNAGSNSALLNVNGGTSGVIDTINVFGTYFESFCADTPSCSTPTGNLITLNNVNNVTISGVKFNGGPQVLNCIRAQGSLMGQVVATGRAASGVCTNVINNTNGFVQTMAGDFEYHDAGANSGFVAYNPGLNSSFFSNGTGGTTANSLVTLNNSNQAVNVSAGATGGVIGICDRSCGTSGTGVFITNPSVHGCIFDNGPPTPGDYVGISSSVAGECTDTGLSNVTTAPPGLYTAGWATSATAITTNVYPIFLSPSYAPPTTYNVPATFSAGVNITPVPESGNFNFSSSAANIVCTAGAGGLTGTLPMATNSGAIYTMLKTDAAAGACVANASTNGGTVNGGNTDSNSTQYIRRTYWDCGTNKWCAT